MYQFESSGPRLGREDGVTLNEKSLLKLGLLGAVRYQGSGF